MNLEVIYSIVNISVMPAWALLIFGAELARHRQNRACGLRSVRLRHHLCLFSQLEHVFWR